jgi:hypothetical protein
MKKLLAGAAIALAPFTAPVGVAGTANASSPGDQDGVTYAAEMDAASPFGAAVKPTQPWQARNYADLVCKQRQAGNSESAVIAWMPGGSLPQFRPNVTYDVQRAEFHFCPQYSS